VSDDWVTIGQLARDTGCKIPTIRYYETVGLLPPPPRSAGNQRLYGPAHRRRLAFIRHARALGFGQPAIRELLDLAGEPERPCSAADAIALRHLVAVDRRIAALTALRDELQRMVGQCDGGRVADCRVLEVLADHGRCLAEHGEPFV
jgi:DNA-binding transcriptional MerR regulator